MEPPAEDKEQKNIESNDKDGTAAPRQDAPFSCEGKGRLLVVLAGLMRDYDKTWPKVQRSLQMDKWEACKVGMPMVIVDTDLSNPCSEKDIKAKRCDEGRLTGQALENDYKKTIGRWYGKTILDDAKSWHRFASVGRTCMTMASSINSRILSCSGRTCSLLPKSDQTRSPRLTLVKSARRTRGSTSSVVSRSPAWISTIATTTTDI